MPRSGAWPTVWAFLTARYGIPEDELARRTRAGDLVLENGSPVEASTRYRPGAAVFIRRDAPDEASADGPPPPLPVLHRDGHLVVVDKPHGVATTPGGRHVARSALVRLRRELDLPDLAPVHRLDRMTAGVLLLTGRPEVRRAYQELFERRAVSKTYEAVAPVRPDLRLPVTVRSTLTKTPGVLRATNVREGSLPSGEQPAPNAETLVELTAVAGGLGLYRVTPRTGRTHQIRVHLASLAVPVVGDPLYPHARPEADGDDGPALQLLAREVAFTDPLTGRPRRFTSRRELAVWRAVTTRA